MGEHAILLAIENSIQALGRGFDANHDIRLLYCKGAEEAARGGSRIVELDENHTRDVVISDGLVVPSVPRDVRCSPESGALIREQTGACTFLEMVEYFSRKSHLPGSVPIGSFNSAFSFTGSKKTDADSTKCLCMDAIIIPIYKVQLMWEPSTLCGEARGSVPLSWEPSSLSRFIETYGTHVITSITIGGKDAIYVKQHSASSISAKEIKTYTDMIGDQRFSDSSEIHTSSSFFNNKAADPFTFNNQGVHPQPSYAPYLTPKEDVTVIFRRRGGDDLIQNHTHWARTVHLAPDVIEMTFLPITSLLGDLPGKEHLISAINLFLEHKPPIQELRYFLEFQVPRVWAPVRDPLPGGRQRKEPVRPTLQFSVMGQKLYVSQEQVSVGRKPVTGLRLCLEGSKHNRLCIEVQHLASLPKIFHPYWDAHVSIGAPRWQGPEEQDSRWFEPVKWKSFSHVSTAPVEVPQPFPGIDISPGVFVVTGAQLGVWDFGSKNVLYMKLLYSKVPGCSAKRSLWDHVLDKKPSSEDQEAASGKYFVKIVDLTEMCRGPCDSPGHWLVTGGKLGIEKGKLVLRVKYSLLNY